MSRFLSPLFLALALAGAATARVNAQNPTPLLTRSGDQLVAVLQSGAGVKEKADACRELAVIGTADAVPALVALLPDEKLSHMARYALETIPGAAVDAALRDALGRLEGRPLVGVIGSVGVRRDEQAVQPLIRLLASSDPDVAQAAARALGRIATPGATAALREALPRASAANQLAFCEGLLRCAESASGENAVKLYDALRATDGLPHQVKAAAWRGAILSRGETGTALLSEALQSKDYIVVAAGARAAIESSASGVTGALTASLAGLSEENRVLVIQALGKRRDAAAVPALEKGARSGSKAVRVAALRALSEVARGELAPVFVGLMGDADGEVVQAAKEGLAGLAGREADAAVLALLGKPEASQRLTAIELIARRRMLDAIPELLRSAGDADAQVRAAALKRVGELGGAAEVPALVGQLTKATAGSDLEAAEQALGELCRRVEDPEGHASRLAASMVGATPAQQAAILRLLVGIGGQKAIETVRASVKASEGDVRAAAIRALAAWRTAEAAPDLLALAKATGDATERTLCLRGYLDWASNPELPPAQRLGMSREAASLIQSADEKKLLLAALGSVKTPEAAAVLAPYVEDAAVRQEAGVAIAAIADELLKGNQAAKAAPALVGPLEKVVSVASGDLLNRAKGLLEKARSVKP